MSPLNISVTKGNIHISKILIEFGAHINNYRNSNSCSNDIPILFKAVLFERESIVDYLKGVNSNSLLRWENSYSIYVKCQATINNDCQEHVFIRGEISDRVKDSIFEKAGRNGKNIL